MKAGNPHRVLLGRNVLSNAPLPIDDPSLLKSSTWGRFSRMYPTFPSLDPCFRLLSSTSR